MTPRRWCQHSLFISSKEQLPSRFCLSFQCVVENTTGYNIFLLVCLFVTWTVNLILVKLPDSHSWRCNVQYSAHLRDKPVSPLWHFYFFSISSLVLRLQHRQNPTFFFFVSKNPVNIIRSTLEAAFYLLSEPLKLLVISKQWSGVHPG